MRKIVLTTASVFIISTTAFAAAPIADYAVSKFTPKSYPKLYATYGDAGLAKINKLAPMAAQKAAESSECDRVEIVDVSGNRSTQSSIVFFADCANGKRFYISESDLASSSSAMSQTAKMSTYTDKQAIDGCEKSIKAQLNNPINFDRKATTTSVYRAPSTGNIVVTFEFTAKNHLGGKLPQKAKCVITEKGVEDALILK